MRSQRIFHAKQYAEWLAQNGLPVDVTYFTEVDTKLGSITDEEWKAAVVPGSVENAAQDDNTGDKTQKSSANVDVAYGSGNGTKGGADGESSDKARELTPDEDAAADLLLNIIK